MPTFKITNEMLKDGTFDQSIIPAGTTYIDLTGCTDLTSLKGITFNGDAALDGCTSLTSLEGTTFKGKAYLTGCTGLTSLAGVTFNGDAALDGCTGLTSLEGTTFKGKAYLTGCTGLTSLAGVTFNGDAALDGCTGLTSLAGVTFNGNAYLTGCTGLTSLAGVTFKGHANLKGCTGLTSLAGVTFEGDVHLEGCTGLIPTAELIAQLEAIEAAGKRVTWPKHFNRVTQIEMAQDRLAVVTDQYKKKSPPGTHTVSTDELFHRFLNEGLGQRDGAAAVVESVNPLLELLEKEPKHLAWIEKVAERYLEGCINQPVAGFSEICAWASVAQTPETHDKIEAARQLMALEVLKQFVADSKVGEITEVESGNTLLREVHKRLVLSGMKPWLGVPGSVSYEGMVKTWLTLDKIIEATKKVAKENCSPLPEVAAYLMNINAETWTAVAFPEIVAETEQKYSTKKEALGILVEPDSGESISEQYKSEVAEYEEMLKDIPPADRADKIGKIFYALDTEKQTEITARVREATDKAAQPKAKDKGKGKVPQNAPAENTGSAASAGEAAEPESPFVSGPIEEGGGGAAGSTSSDWKQRIANLIVIGKAV